MYEVTEEQRTCDGWKLCQSYTPKGGAPVLCSLHPNVIPEMQFTVGEWTYRRKGWGPLAVFKDKLCAVSFYSYTVVPDALYRISILRCCFTLSSDKGVWNDRRQGLWSGLPGGTFFANAVMILPGEM